MQERIDLNELLVNHPNSTYLVEVAGYRLKDIGIYPHDILIVDRAISPKHKNIVIALVDDGFMAKQLILGEEVILRRIMKNILTLSSGNIWKCLGWW